MGRLGRKQSVTHEDFITALRNATAQVSLSHINALIDRTVEEVRDTVGQQRVAYCWSGGKDSQVLRLVAERAGIVESVIALTDLEYPAFLAWATDNMPLGLTIMNNGWDMDWLRAHQGHIFPMTSAVASKWYSGVQWAMQDSYFAREKMDILVLGRRLIDGNQCGDARGLARKSNGTVRYCPLRHWTHEEMFAAIRYFNLAIPPIYDWPRGFRVGSGPWPARRWCSSPEMGWHETWTIDADIVRAAANHGIEGAARFIDKYNLG
jgi:3'-phosphoadenosine 5'-phosphosulfate sulfotransferase (PAPS reductase)/FAD synthetase